MIFFYLMAYIAVFLAAAGQVMLKIGLSAGGIDLGIIRFNTWIAMGLGAMVLSMLLNVRALSVVPLRDLAFIMPTIYIIVPLLSKIFLKEQMGYRAAIGTFIMIAGIVLFNFPFL